MTGPTFLIAFGLFLMGMTSPGAQSKPERVVVFMIDGLHWKAPQKLDMQTFNSLMKEGVYIEKSYMITPHHPTVGEYGKFNTSSFPNPVFHQGTIFIRETNKMVQEVFSPEASTAFIVNTTAYESVARGFTTAILEPSFSDEEVVRKSIEIIEEQDPVFVRIHLQTAGNEGRYLSYTTPDKPYFRNIWGEGSPYVKAVEEGDRLLGELVSYLKKSGKWKSTLLIVTSDNGQSEIGWHMMIDQDSWRCPLLFCGPGIARGRELPYFEHTDIVPTICGIMGVNKPNENGGSGLFRKQILESAGGDENYPRNILRINTQINDYNRLKSKIILASDADYYMSSYISFLENELLTPEPFYHQDRFLEWYKSGSTQHLIELNSTILEEMEVELSKSKQNANNHSDPD